MLLEEINAGVALIGLEPLDVATVIAAVPLAQGVVQVIYKTQDGTIKERLLSRADESSISIATTGRPWSFDGDGNAFKLAVEAKRIDLAFLFDPMMAVHTSNVEPLPHQITAVYEAMLPHQPLRFVLADDPGAGKTIMAGLYIRELIMRADSRRILVVAPGSLVEQWRDELFEKFGLQFNVFSSALEAATPTGNPFEDLDHLIVRLDQMSRNEELQEKLLAASWDLVVFDEAHKLAAHFFGNKLEKTGRFQLAEKLGARTRHLLLMTATPHNGKEEDFQLFLSILDSDRFYGKFRDGVHKVDCSDLMRRMVKEEMFKFDGTPLFPERRAYTANYKLSCIESALYEAVTSYVKGEMGKADALTGSRKSSVGFALTALQRRVASSPEAIFQSLRRRHDRLEARLREDRLMARGQHYSAQNLEAPPEDDDDLTAEEREELEEKLTDTATAAATIAELEAEIAILAELVIQARGVIDSGLDRKWDELSQILQNNPNMRDADGRQRKMIIFTEHRDTLNYLERKIGGVLGTPAAITTIHGSVHRDERRKRQEMFRSDPEVRILLATDAAGEGVNLQNANLMVNYDLPWNPNRIEQRFGRNRREPAPVLKRYERVCFTKEAVRPLDRPNAAFAQMIHPGHPLMLAVSDLILEQNSNLMRQGAILVDPVDDTTEASLLFLITHEIKSGDSSILSKRLQFVRVTPEGKASFAGWAPHLDYESLDPVDRPLLDDLLQSEWMRVDQEQRALALAARTLVPEHYNEIAGRLENRKKELQSMRHVTNGTPVVLGGALVIPAGLLNRLRAAAPGVSPSSLILQPSAFSSDPIARTRIEQLAMNAVSRAEESRGYRVVDVSAQKCGWDITSYAPTMEGRLSEARHIEVKGRVKGATTVTVTKNEIFASWNQGDKYHLAIVLVNEDDSVDGPHYIPHPFKEEPGWGVSSVNYSIPKLLEKVVKGN